MSRSTPEYGVFTPRCCRCQKLSLYSNYTMRKVIAEIAVSVDGFIEGANGELDWLVFEEDANYVNVFLDRFDVIFYGRLAYERFGVFLSPDMHEDSFGRTLMEKRKYVFSRSRKHVEGNGMVIGDRIRERVVQIKEEEWKDIWLCGGARIIKTFASLGLIDEYILAIQPVILGSGKSLFQQLSKRIRLNLLNAEPLSSGVVLINYEPVPASAPSHLFVAH
jgi:dihydrofolate reductase